MKEENKIIKIGNFTAPCALCEDREHKIYKYCPYIDLVREFTRYYDKKMEEKRK